MSGNTLRVTNLTGHKLITGYPEGRRMWIRTKWHASDGSLLREDGAYGEIDVFTSGAPQRVRTILDLGAAPGSWSQVAAKLGAKIVAVDRSPIQPLAGVTTIRGDITKPETVAQIEFVLGGTADLVMSDVAPATSGVHFVEHARSIELARASLQLAIRFLKPDGEFVVKVFQGEDFDVCGS